MSFFLTIPCGGYYVDDPYQGAPLDAKRVCVETREGVRGREVVFTIETWEAFPDARLQEVEEPPVAIGINTRRSAAFEVLVYTGAREAPAGRYVPFGVVTTGRRRPEADFSPYSPREVVGGRARVTRVAPDGVEVAVPLRLLPLRPVGTFRWELRVVSEGEPGSISFDYAPAALQPRFRLRPWLP